MDKNDDKGASHEALAAVDRGDMAAMVVVDQLTAIRDAAVNSPDPYTKAIFKDPTAVISFHMTFAASVALNAFIPVPRELLHSIGRIAVGGGSTAEEAVNFAYDMAKADLENIFATVKTRVMQQLDESKVLLAESVKQASFVVHKPAEADEAVAKAMATLRDIAANSGKKGH